MGHVGIQPEHVGLVAADDRTRAKHQFKFRAVGSSTQAFRHSFTVWTVGDWNSFPSHVVDRGTVNRIIFQGGAVQVDVGRIRTVKRHPPFTRYSTRRTVNYLSASESESGYHLRVWGIQNIIYPKEDFTGYWLNSILGLQALCYRTCTCSDPYY